jgi:hypothetical protein
MRAILCILLLLPLAGCLDELKAPSPQACFEIHSDDAAPDERRILLNKCTGESWMLARSSNMDGSHTFGWFKIAKFETSLSLSSPKK